ETLGTFALLDDYDIISAIKEWQFHQDMILSSLSKKLINRNLLKIKLSNEKFPADYYQELLQRYANESGLTKDEAKYFVFKGKINNQAYTVNVEPIHILRKDGTVEDVVDAADQLSLKALSKPVTKYYICFP